MRIAKPGKRVLFWGLRAGLLLALVGGLMLLIQSSRVVLAKELPEGLTAPAIPLTDVSGNITTDTTWTTANSPYRVTGALTIKPGATLTIQPGVRVEFAQYQGLWVEGTLHAVGTSAAPITFTGTTEQASWWRGIYMQNGGSATLTYAHVCYAGYYDSMGVWKRAGGALNLQDSVIRNIGGDGLRLEAGSGSFTSARNSFRDNSRYGVNVGIGVSFNDDTSTFSGNGTDVYLSGGAITGQTTWNLHPNYSFYVSSSVTVAEGGRLNILPDTVVKFAQYNGLYVNGTLNAIGLNGAVRPIIFTDWRDDAVGGDANKDGSATAPAANWWRGVYVQNAGTATLTHVTIRYTGYYDAIGLRKTGSGNLTLTDTVIQHGRGNGLHVWDNSGLVTLARVILENQSETGMRLANAGTVTGSNCVFRNNGEYGIRQDVNDNFGYTGNSFSGNGQAGVGINGGARAGNMLLSPAGNPFRVIGDVTVNAGATLTVEGGSRLEFAQFIGLWVNGNLHAVDAGASPIIFTGATEQAGWWRGIYVQNAGSATLAYAQVRYGGYYSAMGIWKTGSGALNLQNSIIRNTAGDGLRIAAGYSSLTSAGNHFANNNYGIRLGINASFDDKTSTFTGNNQNVYVDSGAIDQAVTWNLSSDYSFFVSGNITVGEAGRLEILPDTVVKFAQFTGIWVDGTLVTGNAARSTAAGPVYLTDLRDDTVGGDANGDGSATAPAANWWRGIYVRNAGTATLTDSHLRYTGYYDGMGVRKSGTGTLAMSNASIRHSRQYGLQVTDNTGQVTLDTVTLAENGVAGMHLSSAGPVTGTNSSFQDNVLYGLLQGTEDTFNYEGNLFTGNGQAGVAINGYNRTTDMVLQPAGNPFLIVSGLQIEEGATLTVEAGTQIHFSRFYGLTINGNLHAVATGLSPILFTGDGEEVGYWRGIHVQNAGSANLSHVEISYAGYYDGIGLRKTGSNFLILRNSTIRNTNGSGLHLNDSTGHHDITRNLFTANGTGVLVQSQAETLFLVNNLIEGNTDFGVRNLNAATVYARYNWWGHASGPKHTPINPGGQGDTVSDGVIFHPWNETRTVEQPIPEEVLVVSSGPSRLSPGQQVDYMVSYNNFTTGAVQNSVLMVRLPALATYMESSAGGIYWPERHQVFWKLGTLPLGAQGKTWVRVQYQWGIPSGQTDNTATLLVGSNYNTGLLDLNAYLNYVPPTVTASQSLSQSQWDALLAGAADLNALYTQALADGYLWASAERVTLNSGIVTQAVLIHGQQRNVRVLYDDGVQAYATTFAPRHYATTDGSGGMEWDIGANQQSVWGSWDLTTGAAWPGTRISPESCDGAGCCLSNCLSKVALTAVAGKLSTAVNAALTTKDCYDAYRTKTPDALAKCAANVKSGILKVKNVPVLGELAGITECLAQCAGNPNSNDCTGDLITCESSWSNLYEWLGVPSRTVWRCKSGCYSNLPEYIPCAFGECCIPGVGCSGGGSGSHCRPERVIVARDPNEIRGPEGDLLPGQWVPYTVEYENVGAGTAYGVFITAELDEVFDDTTLLLGGSGVYYPNVRLISWDIGDLAPKGQAGATGEVTMTVKLRTGLPSGTVVPNGAVVTFPSVPEETPTNTWINLIAPLVATPQDLTTNYMTPRAITLSGKEASSLPLTYEIVEQPHGGTLTGTPPNLSYTPGENFTGPDSFSFRVDNGTSTSRAAQVRIDIAPAGDTARPTVLWTVPAADATGVIASTSPVFTDTVGPLYSPTILIGISEALNPATVTAANVTLTGSGGAVSTLVAFDAGTNQIVLRPRTALGKGTYTVTVNTAVTDVAGNALASPYLFRFSVGTVAESRIYLPAVQR